MDVVIVSTCDAYQAEYWQRRLNQAKPKLLKPSAHIICIAEDWAEGAGNGLGTLYAYQQACRKSKALFNLDLDKSLENGAAVALYQTSGMGKRLYPLAGSEHCNKSAVKLPGFLPDSQDLISILEGLIHQTTSFAPFRRGRLSVFWGDQIFIPSSPYEHPKHHIEILTQNAPFPHAAEWIKKGYDHYGFVISQPGGIHAIFEKMDTRQFEELVKNRSLGSNATFGLSLGSFSLSHSLLKALLNLFKPELDSKQGKLDTDVHFWMPLLLDEDTYLDYMAKKKSPLNWAAEHYRRMQTFKQTLDGDLFSPWDIGSRSHWWDYGNVAAYYSNNMQLIQTDSVGECMRNFLGWKQGKPQVDENGSLLINCQISGKVKNSILINVEAQDLDVTNTLIINSKIHTLKADQCLLYQVTETAPLSLEGEVRADVLLPSHKSCKMYAKIEEDGKKNWDTRLPNNTLSFHELSQLIQKTTL